MTHLKCSLHKLASHPDKFFSVRTWLSKRPSLTLTSSDFTNLMRSSNAYLPRRVAIFFIFLFFFFTHFKAFTLVHTDKQFENNTENTWQKGRKEERLIFNYDACNVGFGINRNLVRNGARFLQLFIKKVEQFLRTFGDLSMFLCWI